MRETAAAWRDRKRAELSLLARAAGEVEPILEVASVAALIELKCALRARLLARAATASPLVGETNLSGRRIVPLGRGALAYDYQRYDLGYRRKPFASVAYALSGVPSALSIGVLAGSGMAAISATLTALDQLEEEGTKLLLAADAYFETLFYVHRYLRRLTPEMGTAALDGSVLYLDSFGAADPFARWRDRDLSPLRALVLDTTCLDGDAPLVDEIAGRCLAAGVPCALVRSHLKLDQIGVEYGRLGSVVLVFPRRASVEKIRWLKLLLGKIRNALTVHGGNFSPLALFPPALDPALAPSLRELNRQRNRIARANNRVAARVLRRLLAESTTAVTDYHHGCFFVLRPFLDTVHATTLRCAALVAALRAGGVEARVAPSFGYDFVAVTRVAGVANTRAAIRVALPDFPVEELRRTIGIIARYAAPLSVD